MKERWMNIKEREKVSDLGGGYFVKCLHLQKTQMSAWPHATFKHLQKRRKNKCKKYNLSKHMVPSINNWYIFNS